MLKFEKLRGYFDCLGFFGGGGGMGGLLFQVILFEDWAIRRLMTESWNHGGDQNNEKMSTFIVEELNWSDFDVCESDVKNKNCNKGRRVFLCSLPQDYKESCRVKEHC